MSQQRCPGCGAELVDGIIIGGTMWADSRTRFVPARFVNDRSLFGRYRREVPAAARACRQCGMVTLLVNPGMLEEVIDGADE